MKTYMNKKTLAIVTLIAQVDNRYTVEYEDGTQKSYAESSFKRMFKFVEEVDDNTDTNVEEVTETEADEPVQIVLDDVVTPTESIEPEKVYTDEVIPAKPKKPTNKKVKKAADNAEICVEMRAFTGMVIGTFTAKLVGGLYEVATKGKKILHFDSDGIQTDAKNPKFGNKIVVLN